MLSSYVLTPAFVDWLGLIVATTSIFYVVRLLLEKTRLPPGPPRLPVLGSLPFMTGDIRSVLAELRKKYGDIYTFYLGSEPIVVLNGYGMIQEALIRNEGMIDGRSVKQFRDISKNLGVASVQGEMWSEQRRFVIQTLRNFGLGRRGMDDFICDEASHLLEQLHSVGSGTAYDVNPILMMCSCNVVCTLINGHRFEYDDPEFLDYVDLSKELLSLIGINNPVFMLDVLKYLPGDVFGYRKAISDADRLRELYKKWIQDHRRRLKSGEEAFDLIGIYLQEMEKNKEQNNYFFDDQLVQVIMDLFIAGTDTTANTLTFAILYMVLHVDIQEKVQAEIDRVIGSHRKPTMADRNKMSYTLAVLTEVQRISTIAPLAVPHAAMEDTTLAGYAIAKDTVVIVNLRSVHFDAELFPEPNEFRPERFLDENNDFKDAETCIPFSVGKRACLALSMAKAELFLVFTHLLQHFKFKLPPNEPKPDVRGEVGLTTHTKPFKVLLENRL